MNNFSRQSASGGDPSPGNKAKSHRYCRHNLGPPPAHGKTNFDSGKSSDSSLSSSYRHGNDGGSLRVEQRTKLTPENTYDFDTIFFILNDIKKDFIHFHAVIVKYKKVPARTVFHMLL